MRRKYGNKKVTIDGMTFDSIKEAKRYGELKILQRKGEISGLGCQPRFDLFVNGERICFYRADFDYMQCGKRVVEDVKGVKTPVYQLKKRLMKACLGITITEI